jgi:hypothetical protein
MGWYVWLAKAWIATDMPRVMAVMLARRLDSPGEAAFLSALAVFLLMRAVLQMRRLRYPNAPMLLRAHRFDLPQGAVTHRHGHAAPLSAACSSAVCAAKSARRISASMRARPGSKATCSPWSDHTLAPASAFFRCMVLDLELLGRLTFRPAQPEDAAKPRGVGHRRFFDTIVTLPR